MGEDVEDAEGLGIVGECEEGGREGSTCSGGLNPGVVLGMDEVGGRGYE